MNDPIARAHLRFGWTAITLFLSLGAVLETLHLFKAPLYVEAPLRRELWTLAHAHGTLFGLVNVGFAACVATVLPEERARRHVSRPLLAGSLLLPLGFLLGGIGNAEGDPSPSIVLVPFGALLLLYACARTALGAWRRAA
jgi:hypothetical protein